MAIIDQNELLIEKAIDKLDRKIFRLTSRLSVRNGRLTSDAIDLKRAIGMRNEITKEFLKFDSTMRRATNYNPVLKEVDKVLKTAGINNVITDIDKTLIQNLSTDSFNQSAGLSSQYASKVTTEIYTSVVVGDQIDDLTLNVRQLLKGGTDKAGRPMESHAKTIATTGYREADSVLLQQKANEFEIDKFEYAGSLIKDSRLWCKNHVGKVYTLEEIEKWEGQTWKGKKGGNPFITRGGWNCRHRWLLIVD